LGLTLGIEKSPAFHEFLQLLTQQAAQVKVQNLFSLLVLPVQRIPRYEMLFADLLRHTPDDHEGTFYWRIFQYVFYSHLDKANIQVALDKIIGVARKIDEAKHEFDCNLMMKKV
jgi:hypothetical protein